MIREVSLCMKMSIVVLLASACVCAQDRGTVKVYREQFAQLHKRATDLMAHTEQEARNGIAQDKTGLELQGELQHEILALTGLVQRLGQDASRSYVDALRESLSALKENRKQNQNPNKDVLFVALGCDQLAVALSSLGNFLTTEDKAFLGFAKQGNELASVVEKLM